MPSKIERLPEFVANQIAAGEVVQRPASVVKELMENAIDAGCSSLIVSIKDGGSESIQVIDDGMGMSFDDALLAFERHATSKIARIEDLFALKTFGFRGEALPSIASIAEIELKTRRENDELGAMVVINGGQVVGHSETNCPKGTQFAVRNLFYNVPARRKFLKKDHIEANHVETEFCRVALCNPAVSMFFYKNNECKHNLPASNLRQRIANLTKKNMNNYLIDVFVESSIVKLAGFIGKPEAARKSPEQYFFVNGRFFRSPYFQKAVMQAYQKLLPNREVAVPFFLYLTVDPAKMDVNIHPTKTEIKFEDEQAIWQIILAAVRESLGKYGVVPMIDFDVRDRIDIPVPTSDTVYKIPEIEVNPNFNPFDEDFSFPQAVGTEKTALRSPGSHVSKSHTVPKTSALYHLGNDFESGMNNDYAKEHPGDPFSSVEIEDQQDQHEAFPPDNDSADFSQGDIAFEADTRISGCFALSRRYIAACVNGQLLFIDAQRAAFRIAYERFLQQMEGTAAVTQQEMFPQDIDLSPSDREKILEHKDELSLMGFDLKEGDGHGTIVLQGVPAWMKDGDSSKLFEDLLHYLAEDDLNAFAENGKERLAMSMAAVYRKTSGALLSENQATILLENLLYCKDCNFTPDGKRISAPVTVNEIAVMLK